MSLLLLLILASCNQKEEFNPIPEISEEANVHAVFDSRVSYESIFDTNNKVSKELYSPKGFVSLRDALDDYYGNLESSLEIEESADSETKALAVSKLTILKDTIYNDYGKLAEVLNQDKIVEIGDNLIKVDLHTEKVYVLNCRD